MCIYRIYVLYIYVYICIFTLIFRWSQWDAPTWDKSFFLKAEMIPLAPSWHKWTRHFTHRYVMSRAKESCHTWMSPLDFHSRSPAVRSHDTGWRRCIGCFKLQVSFCKRATNYRALLRKETYNDKVWDRLISLRHIWLSEFTYDYVVLGINESCDRWIIRRKNESDVTYMRPGAHHS